MIRKEHRVSAVALAILWPALAVACTPQPTATASEPTRTSSSSNEASGAARAFEGRSPSADVESPEPQIDPHVAETFRTAPVVAIGRVSHSVAGMHGHLCYELTYDVTEVLRGAQVSTADECILGPPSRSSSGDRGPVLLALTTERAVSSHGYPCIAATEASVLATLAATDDAEVRALAARLGVYEEAASVDEWRRH